MNRIVETFNRPRVLLPVIHPIDRDNAVRNARIALDAGAPGVFLVDQGTSEEDLLPLIDTFDALFPQLWLGVNLLTREPHDALSKLIATCDGIHGLWSDNAGIDERVGPGDPQPEAEKFLAARDALKWPGLYFGGVAFKHQRKVADRDLGYAASNAALYMDVVCTSGPATGVPADLAKIRVMSDTLTEFTALAVASGITAENIGSYLPYVDVFLVGTGLEKEFGVFDPVKVKAVARAIESFTP